MPDDEIWTKLGGAQDSSVRLEFARGVAHHSVTLVRQRLSIVPTSASAAVATDSGEEDANKTITAAPVSLARDLQIQASLDSSASPAKSASPASSQGDYVAFQDQSPPPAAPVRGDGAVAEPLQLTAIKAATEMQDSRGSNAQPLQPFSPNKEMPCVIKTKSTVPTPTPVPIPRIGVNSRLNLPTPNVEHFHSPSQPKLQRSALPPEPGFRASSVC